jgi:VWFA-related protein
MSNLVRSILTMLLLAGVPPVFAYRAQEQQPPPTPPRLAEADFYIGTQEVLIDLVVTDNKGRMINDLKPEEVHVYERGELQKITSFGRATQDGPPNLSTTRLASDGGSSSLRDYNLILIIVDRTSIQIGDLRSVFESTERFLEQDMSAHDLVGVFVIGTRPILFQNFTDDKALILDAVRRATIGGKADQPPFATAIDTGRAAIPLPAPSSNISIAPAGAEGSSFGRLDRTLRDLADRTDSIARLRNLHAIVSEYGKLLGRKSVMLYSEGIPETQGPEVEFLFKRLAGAANRKNICFYTVHPGGLRAPGSINARNLSTSNTALRRIAASTGGVAVYDTNDFYRGFRTLASDLRSYYVLSYAPKNDNFDGGYRPIRVEVLRDNVRVRARDGYYATPDDSALEKPYETPILVAIGSAWAGKKFEGIRSISATPWFAEDEGWFVPVLVGVDGLDLSPLPPANPGASDDPLRLAVDSVAFVRDQNGEIAALLSRQTVFTVPRKQFETFRSSTSVLPPFPQHLVLAPGTYWITVGLRDPQSNRISVQTSRLVLPPLPEPHTPALSSVVLCRAVASISSENWVEMAPDPFSVAGGVRLLPNLTGRYSKTGGDRLIAYARFYNYGATGNRYEAKIVATRGNKVALTNPSAPLSTNGEGEAVYARELPLDSLTEGEYRLRIVITDQGVEVASSEPVPFTVVR